MLVKQIQWRVSGIGTTDGSSLVFLISRTRITFYNIVTLLFQLAGGQATAVPCRELRRIRYAASSYLPRMHGRRRRCYQRVRGADMDAAVRAGQSLNPAYSRSVPAATGLLVRVHGTRRGSVAAHGAFRGAARTVAGSRVDWLSPWGACAYGKPAGA